MQNFKHRLIKWLIREIEATKLRINHSRDCIIGKNSTVAAEGRIENLAGGKDRVHIGDNCFIRAHLLTYGHGGRIKIGDWCYIGEGSKIWSMHNIFIGNRVLISHGVNIHDGSAHSMDATERHEHYKAILTTGHPRSAELLPGLKSAEVIIEDDVWINFGVTILKGVKIGKGSIIAAGSIVTHDVPANSIYINKITPLIVPRETD